MNIDIKGTFQTLVKTPYIMLLLVTYLLITAGSMPLLAMQAGKPAFYIVAGILLLLTAVFLAGWCGTIYSAVSYKETGDSEEDLKNRYDFFKNGFFASIPIYGGAVLTYVVLFMLMIQMFLYIANTVFGDPTELLMRIAPIANDMDALRNFFSTVPPETGAAIFKRSVFLYAAFLIYLLFVFYSLPSLYFKKTCNPLVGLKNGVLAFLKKPAGTISLFLTILLAHVTIIFLEAISENIGQLFMFAVLVLRVCFIAFVVVLIFSVYEKNFADNCNNGGDCLGENRTVG